MPIASAVEWGRSVYVYDEKNRQLFSKGIGHGPKDGLQGYTGGSVCIRWGNTLYIYNERGQQIGTRGLQP